MAYHASHVVHAFHVASCRSCFAWCGCVGLLHSSSLAAAAEWRARVTPPLLRGALRKVISKGPSRQLLLSTYFNSKCELIKTKRIDSIYISLYIL